MHFGLNEDQVALRDVVRDLLEEACPPAVVRDAWQSDDRAPQLRLSARLAELGVTGMLVPEADGGLGLDETYLVPVLVQTGWAGVPLPTIETVAVAAPLLAQVEAYAEVVEQVVAGTFMITCDLGGTGLLPYGQVADAALVADGDAVRFVRLEPGAVSAEQSIDGARRLTRVPRGLGERLDLDPAEVTRARLRGTLGTSAELVGLSRRMIDLAVSYVKERQQFGVPVGSFQAVKHHLADALLAVELAEPTVHQAAWAIATGDGHAARDTSTAKAMTSDAAREVTRLTLQCHGAMAYTTEYDHHLFAKRAWVQAASWGNAAWHRERVAEHLGLLAPATGRTAR